MTCKKCGTVYEGRHCPNGCNTPKKKPIYKKWWFWVLIAVAAIIIIFPNSEENVPFESDTESITANEQDQSVQTQLEETETTATSTNIYLPGDTIDADGLQISYISAEKWDGYNQFSQPEDGYMYIRLYISANNTSSDDRYISSFEFTCYADGKKEESYFGGDEPLEGGTLSSGRSDEGYIYFIVPSNVSEIEVEYELNIWSDKKAILKVEL